MHTLRHISLAQGRGWYTNAQPSTMIGGGNCTFNDRTNVPDANGYDSMSHYSPMSGPSHSRYDNHCTHSCFTCRILKDLKAFNAIFGIPIAPKSMLDMSTMGGAYLDSGGGILSLSS